MDIAIIGASGDVGRALAVQIISRKLLTPRQRLQLVGRRDGGSGRALYGLRADLYDAYAEITPEIDVALTPQEVAADLILFAAGRTVPVDRMISRQELARTNREVFETYARSLAERGHGEELVVVVTNPVELGVEIFSRYLGAHRVIGMGAFQDSMRLRREIAADLGVQRQFVQAYMLGEHGDSVVPILSRLWIYGFDPAELNEARQRLYGGRRARDFPAVLASEKAHLRTLLASGQVEAAFRYADELSADLRAVLLPLITHMSEAKTAVSTAAVTAELVEQLLSGVKGIIPAQVRLTEHDWNGPAGVLGVPVVLGLNGWSQVTDLEMDDEEWQCLLDVARDIRQRVQEWSQ